MTYTLDHIAVACADLEVGAAWLSGKLGVPLLDGGRHAHFGTHNKLLGLADGLYLEVIAPDPDANISVPRWFNLDHAPDVPAWGNWIAQAADLNAMASLTGPPVDRRRVAAHGRWLSNADKMGGGYGPSGDGVARQRVPIDTVGSIPHRCGYTPRTLRQP
jgi:hypothetical protein